MRGRLGLAGLVAVALLAGGCAAKAELGGILAADAANTARETSRVAVAVTMRSPGMSVTFSQTGVFDYAHSRGVLRAANGAGIAQEVFLPPHVYMKLTDGSGMLPRGKSWIEANLTSADGLGGLPLTAFPGAPQGNPSDMLSSLLGASKGAVQVGSATIRGVQTVHYRVTIDLAKAAAQIPPSSRAAFTLFAQAFGRQPFVAQVWVDQKGLVRRVLVSLTPAKSSGERAGTQISQTVDFYDFGVPVRVTAPPASEVVSSSELGTGNGPPGGGATGPAVPEGPAPPRASDTLSPSAASAAARAVRAFWAGLGANDVNAAAQAVAPTQRSCLLSAMKNGPTFTIKSLRIMSVRPNGPGRATVLFKLDARVWSAGASAPIGPTDVLWFATTEIAHAWYVDLHGSAPFGPGCGP